MKFELKKILFLILWIGLGFIAISILAFLFIAFMYRINDFWLFAWIIPNGAEGKTPTTTPTNSAETLRNFAWLFWMFLSLSGAGLGLWLAWRGRQIQQEQLETQNKSHLQERQEGFQKAADMLSSEIELTRLAACRSLMNLATSEASLKSACVRLLFDFINNPYLETNDKDKNLDELFPENEPLRSDIQSAIDSFSGIYGHYSEVGIDSEAVKLSSYFWKNEKKGKISLIKASLQGVNLQNAYLPWANLQGASSRLVKLRRANLIWVNLREAKLLGADLREVNLRGARLQKASLRGARLQKANLRGAKFEGASLQDAGLQDADISYADMQNAKNLAKEQILSAKWGYSRLALKRYMGPPKLPKEFMQDGDIQEWLKTPAYDERKSKDSQ